MLRQGEMKPVSPSDTTSRALCPPLSLTCDPHHIDWSVSSSPILKSKHSIVISGFFPQSLNTICFSPQHKLQQTLFEKKKAESVKVWSKQFKRHKLWRMTCSSLKQNALTSTEQQQMKQAALAARGTTYHITPPPPLLPHSLYHQKHLPLHEADPMIKHA